MPRRAYSYDRVSGRPQEKGYGLERQGEYAPWLCEQEGWQLDDTLVLCDVGKSAFRGANAVVGDLSRFLEAVQTGRVTPGSVLIIENLDRLSRDEVDEAYDLFRSLIRAGIWIATREPRRIYSKETSKNFLELLEPLFLFLRAHEESATKSFRARDNWARKRKAARESGAAMHKGCPFWLEREGDGYRMRPDRKDVMLQMIEWSLDGLGEQRIAERLTNDGVPPWGRAQKRRGVVYQPRWSRSTVRELLSSVALYGAYQPNTFVEAPRAKHPTATRMKRVPEGEPICTRPDGKTTYYPALITEKQWECLQRARTQRAGNRPGADERTLGSGRPGADERNLFTGLICRAVTGKRMQVKPSAAGGRVYHYLREQEPAECPDRIEYISFERAVLRVINDLTPADLSPCSKDVGEREARIGELTRQLEAIENRCNRLADQIADPDTEPEGASALATIVARLAVSKATLVKELAALQDQTRPGRAEELGELKGMIELLDEEEGPALADLRRRIKARLRSLVACVWVLVQPVCPGSRFVHMQIDLKAGGRCRPATIPQMRKPHDVMPWSLDEVDLSSLTAAALKRLTAKRQAV